MDIFEENNDEIVNYVYRCKYINHYKLMNRFGCSDEEAYEIIYKLMDKEIIVPTVNFDFLVVHRMKALEE